MLRFGYALEDAERFRRGRYDAAGIVAEAQGEEYLLPEFLSVSVLREFVYPYEIELVAAHSFVIVAPDEVCSCAVLPDE